MTAETASRTFAIFRHQSFLLYMWGSRAGQLRKNQNSKLQAVSGFWPQQSPAKTTLSPTWGSVGAASLSRYGGRRRARKKMQRTPPEVQLLPSAREACFLVQPAKQSRRRLFCKIILKTVACTTVMRHRFFVGGACRIRSASTRPKELWWTVFSRCRSGWHRSRSQ